MSASFVEAETRPGDQVLDGLCASTSPGPASAAGSLCRSIQVARTALFMRW